MSSRKKNRSPLGTKLLYENEGRKSGSNADGLPPVTVRVESLRLQDDGDEGHDGLDEAELQRGLLAEAQELDGVGAAGQAAGAVEPAGADGLAADLAHDVALAAQVLVAQGEEVVDDERLVAVAERVKVHVVAVVVEEEQRQPRGERVDRHDEQDPHDPPLLRWVRVEPQVLVDLPPTSSFQYARKILPTNQVLIKIHKASSVG